MTDRPEEQQNDLLKDPAFLRGLTMRRMTRRDLFRSAGVGAGALSLGAILAACGGTSAGGGGGGGDTGGGGSDGGIDWNAEPNGTLNFANWPLYIDKAKVNGQVTYPSLDEFTAATGIEVKYREVDQLERGVLRQDPAAAGGRAVDRVGHHRHHERHHAGHVAPAGLPGAAANGQASELRRERERRREGPRVRPGERVHHGVAVGPDRHRMGPGAGQGTATLASRRSRA